MFKELKFLLSLWKTNLQSVMEYRLAFLLQIAGMMLNNGVYFLFWVIFFDRFRDIRGWGLSDMFLIFGIAASSFGLASLFFGNVFNLSDLITNGRLDYYLSLPKPVLLHAIASRSIASGMGDFLYGIISFVISGQFSWGGLARFLLGIMLGTVVLVSFLIITQSLAFWLGNASGLSTIALNAIITFSIYPINLFEGSAKFILFTIIPAAFLGAIPAEFIRHFSWLTLLELLMAASALLATAIFIFHLGLHRYESGSSIQVEV